jgi:hypothetical protein
VVGSLYFADRVRPLPSGEARIERANVRSRSKFVGDEPLTSLLNAPGGPLKACLKAARNDSRYRMKRWTIPLTAQVTSAQDGAYLVLRSLPRETWLSFRATLDVPNLLAAAQATRAALAAMPVAAPG